MLFSLFAIGAYLLQILFTVKQMNHFNKVYQELRNKGKVAIGKRAGGIKAGTIVMFALDEDAKVIDARKMQGVTVLSKFISMPQFVGEDLHYIDRYNPKVRKENKLTQQAMEHAREVFLRIEVGNYDERPTHSPLQSIRFKMQYMKEELQSKIKRSV